MTEHITINIISDLDDFRWLPLVKLRPNTFTYVFSKSPIAADFHVVFHVKTKMEIPNSRERIAFVITEPPEIEVIKIKFLKQFGIVLSPEFNYLKELNNVKFCGGLLPWQAGFSFAHESVTQNKSLDEIRESWNLERPILLSVITSDKKLTPQQKQRLDFISFLKDRVEGVEVYGRGFNEIRDKADILLKSKYHLALENSTHNGYWTEKFIDPLICGTQIFYAGDESLYSKFESYIQIDLKDFSSSANTIFKAIDSNLWATSVDKRKKDYIKYVNQYNLISELEEWTDNKGKSQCITTSAIRAEKSNWKTYPRKLRLKVISILKIFKEFLKIRQF